MFGHLTLICHGCLQVAKEFLVHPAVQHSGTCGKACHGCKTDESTQWRQQLEAHAGIFPGGNSQCKGAPMFWPTVDAGKKVVTRITTAMTKTMVLCPVPLTVWLKKQDCLCGSREWARQSPDTFQSHQAKHPSATNQWGSLSQVCRNGMQWMAIPCVSIHCNHAMEQVQHWTLSSCQKKSHRTGCCNQQQLELDSWIQ